MVKQLQAHRTQAAHSVLTRSAMGKESSTRVSTGSDTGVLAELLDRRRRKVGVATDAGGLVRWGTVVAGNDVVLVPCVTPELSNMRCLVICVSKRLAQ